MKSRSELNIIRSILESTRQGATKSRIMHDTYLSSEKTGIYLEFLKKHRLLRCELSNKIYHTTEKGFQMLDEYIEINELLYELEFPLSDFDLL